ncbi:MAG: c-type cytochrome [Acidimicrobiia bacterium]
MADLSEVSTKLGVPERLVERSAAARAAAEGVPVEEVLDAWLAGGLVGGEGSPPAAGAPVKEEAPPEEAAEEVPAEEEQAEPVPAPAAAEPEPVPVAAAVEQEVLPDEERDLVTVVGTVGLRERRDSSIPRWLLVAFLVVPLYALFYVVVYAGGAECGAAGLLQVDEETGGLLNCDGSPFTPGGVAGGEGDFLAMGRTLYASSPAVCARCHGRGGEGGTGPPLSGGAVLQTFPDCDTHVQWVTLGSNNWPEGTYGAPQKPVRGGMPSFGIEVGGPLSEEEIRAVVLFERVQHGGRPLEEALAECGLAEPAEEDPAQEGAEGASTSTTGG